jgi:hypothetical protein
MYLKRLALKIAVITFMVFAVSSVTEYSFAYWASNVVPPPTTTTTGDVGVGIFDYYELWSINGVYLIGDQVKNNGVIYQAKKNNPTKEPGVDGGWNSQWTVIG